MTAVVLVTEWRVKAKTPSTGKLSRTTGFFTGRIVIVSEEFTPIPSPPLRYRTFRENSSVPECVFSGIAESIGPMCLPNS